MTGPDQATWPFFASLNLMLSIQYPLGDRRNVYNFRDLHDSLGHQLVAVNVQLQKAVAYQTIDTDESQSAISKAQEATNDAIKELRQTIKDLRDFEEFQNLENELERIVNDVRENGLNLEYNLSGSSSGFPELTL